MPGRGRGSGTAAAWLVFLLLARLGLLVAGRLSGSTAVEVGTDGQLLQDGPVEPLPPSSSQSDKQAAAEALVWDLLDVARREGDKQEAHEQPQGVDSGGKQEVGIVEGTNAAIFSPLLPAIEELRASLPGAYKYFPWAGVLQFILEYGMGCPALTATRTILVNVPPTLGHLHTMRKPINPDGTLPRPLKDLVGYDGDFIDEATVQAERDTYYWYWRIFEAFFTYAVRTGSPGATLLNPIADGWRNQRVHWRNATSFHDVFRNLSPFYLTAEKDGHVMVVIRGTLFEDEWRKDLQFQFAKVEETRCYFEGQVHSGAFKMFKEMVEHLLADLEARKPKEVTFTGHSIGGTLSLFAAAFVAKRWAGRGVKLNAVTFAALGPGDQAFWDGMRQHVNVRNIRFLGEGRVEQDGQTLYTLGDVIPQGPSHNVNHIRMCPYVTDPGNPGLPNEYWAPGSTVAFYPSSLRNAKEWRKRSNLLNLRKFRNIDAHHCSYTCWLTAGVNDPESRCRFPDERGGWWAWLTNGMKQIPDEEVCESAELGAEIFYLINAATYDNPEGVEP